MKVDIYTMSRHKFLLPISMMCGMCAFASVPTVSVTSATQRYPWNGMVDVAFTVSGDSGVKYSVSLGAQDVIGGTNLPMRTVYKADGTVAALTNVLSVGTYKWAWNATADLPNDFSCERVKIDFDVQKVVDISNASYLVIDLTSGEKTYYEVPPEGGWTDDPYKYSKMVFRRIRARTFTQENRSVTLTKDYYISEYPITLGQLSKITEWPITFDGTTAKDSWYNWEYNGSSNPSPTDPYVQYVFGYSNEHWTQTCHQELRDICNPGAGATSSTLTKNWPKDGHSVVATSPIGMLRNKTGLALIDMPTEAQLTLARETIEIGTVANACLDWYESLDDVPVTDPVGPYFDASFVDKYRVGLTMTKRVRLELDMYADKAVVRLCVNLQE